VGAKNSSTTLKIFSKMTKLFSSINPYNGEKLAEYPIMSRLELDKKISLSQKAFKSWKNTSFQERSILLKKAGQILKEKHEIFAQLITSEMGKTIAEARAEVLKSVTVCDYYAEKAEILLAPQILETPFTAKVVYEPIGCVYAIMPWNFPFWQVFRFATAALSAGNTAMLKHAPNVTGCSLAIEGIFREAGFPEGVFQSLISDIDDVEYVVAHDIVQAMTLTGSEKAGVAVGALAGKLLKKSVLELGGSDPVLVLDDANVDKAAQVAVQSRLFNAGQTCISAKRFLVTPKNSEAFIEKVKFYLSQYKQGNPLDETVKVAPLARLDLSQNLHRQLQESLSLGANQLFGGQIDGCNFEPALLVGNSTQMPIFAEETFGPLAAILTVKDENEMLEIANQSPYGLAASIWTEDREKGEKIARKIEAGSVFVNSLVRSDARIPSGGIKKSGYGRELAQEGIKEFTNVKSIIIE